MKAVMVNFDLIAESMRDLSRETTDYFFNRATGRVIGLSRILIRALAERTGDIQELVPDWEAPMIPVAREIVVVGGNDFIRIPEAFGRPEHKWMLEFCATVRGAKLKQKLVFSLKGRESCRRFKEILKENIEEKNRWNVFCHAKWNDMVKFWLESLSILPVDTKTAKRAAA